MIGVTMAKATISYTLALPSHLVVDKIAPSTCKDPSCYTTLEKLQKKYHYTYTQCSSYPLEYLNRKKFYLHSLSSSSTE